MLTLLKLTVKFKTITLDLNYLLMEMKYPQLRTYTLKLLTLKQK